MGYVRKDTFIMWFKIAVACVPAVIIELAMGDKLEEMFYGRKFPYGNFSTRNSLLDYIF